MRPRPGEPHMQAEGNRKHVERIEPMIEHYTRLVQQYRDLAEQKEQQG
jgi:hypothetical protein